MAGFDSQHLASLHIPSQTVMPMQSDSRAQPRLEPSSRSRIQARIGLDYSGITSTGSTPGSSMQRGISFQSDMTNEVSFKNAVSVYHSLIADNPLGVTTNAIRPGAGISRSYLTIHLEPAPLLRHLSQLFSRCAHGGHDNRGHRTGR
jgi:hypothetical protein